MGDRDQQERIEERSEEPPAPESLEDLDVPEGESEDVQGGAIHSYSFKQAWPKKYEG